MNGQDADPAAPLPSRPEAVDALYAVGHWLYMQDRYSDAIRVFRAVLRVAPHDERGWLALGTCHEALDQHDVALELYDQARRTADAAPRCNIARARVMRARGMLADARESLDEAARIADQLDDEEVRALLVAERQRS
jgi:tetratricopeptide (TPR) repeat protein